MRRHPVLLFLLLLITGTVAAYEYHMPVNIHPTINPAVLMPGDEAILAIELQNGAASYGVGKDAGSGSSAQSALLSTPLNRTSLRGTPGIEVMTADPSDLGMIGPNDKITVYYKIKAADNITSGTYLLDFEVIGGYDMITINREIPVKVDSSSVGLARAETAATKSGINLNIANPRENTVNAVTIVPSAKGIRFSPDEYYIGTMDPDEVFTISFGLEFTEPGRSRRGSVDGPVNLSFVAKFKNGDTWHQSGSYIASYTQPKDNSSQNSYLLPAGVAVVILVAAGAYLYRRRKYQGNSRNGPKSA